MAKSVRFKIAFLSLCACNFVSTLDTVIVSTALPAITESLRAASDDAYWCGTGFLFAQTISQPIYGALSSAFGRKACLLFSLSLFTVASVFCATAQNIQWLIMARVFQGIGAGGNNAIVSITVTDMVELHERGTYFGFLSIASTIASVTGSIFAAAVASKSNWRIIFWINLPFCIPPALGIFLFIHLQSEAGTVRSRLEKVDWVGIFLLTGSLTGLLYGITAGKVLQPWNSPQVLSALIIGSLFVVIFIIYEAKVASEPMIPVKILANRTSNAAFFASFVIGLVLWAVQYILILFFLVSRHRSLLDASIAMLPGTTTLPFSALAAGFIVSNTRKFKILNSMGLALLTIGIALVSTLSATSNGWKQFGFQVIYGLGGGVVFVCRFSATQSSQNDKDIPMATALVSFLTSLGQTFGVAICGTVLQNEWSRRVAIAVDEHQLSKQFVLSSGQAEHAAALIAAFPPQIQMVYRNIMAKVTDRLFTILASFAGAAFLASLMAKNISLDQGPRSVQPFTERENDERVAGVVMSAAETSH